MVHFELDGLVAAELKEWETRRKHHNHNDAIRELLRIWKLALDEPIPCPKCGAEYRVIDLRAWELIKIMFPPTNEKGKIE